MAFRDTLRRTTLRIVQVVTRLLMTGGLVLVYFTAVALMAFWLLLTGRRRPPESRGGQASTWGPPEGYEPDLADARRQT
jgi:hypothetical protein